MEHAPLRDRGASVALAAWHSGRPARYPVDPNPTLAVIETHRLTVFTTVLLIETASGATVKGATAPAATAFSAVGRIAFPRHKLGEPESGGRDSGAVMLDDLAVLQGLAVRGTPEGRREAVSACPARAS